MKSADQEVGIDQASAEALRIFPESESTALLFIVMKQKISTDARALADDILATQPGVMHETDDEEMTMRMQEDQSHAPLNLRLEAFSSAVPIEASSLATFPAGDQEKAVSARGGREIQGEGEDEALNALDQTEHNTPGDIQTVNETCLWEVRDQVVALPAQTEVSKLVVKALPLKENDMSDGEWVAVAYFSKVDDVKNVSPLHDQYNMGVLPPDCIFKVDQVISQAYTPAMLRAEAERKAAEKSAGSVSLHSETVSTMNKLSASFINAVVSSRGNVSIELPDVDLEREPALLKMDGRAVDSLRQTLNTWQITVSTMVEEAKMRKPNGNGSLAEVEFWRDRYMNLDGVCERMQMSTQFAIARSMMHTCLPDESCEFEHCFQELSMLHVEAKDNLKFLSTLERHLRTIASAPLGSITDSLPSLFNGFRMVWVLSRHYNTDERMTGLMRRVAEEISDRVKIEINIAELLSTQSPAQVGAMLATSKALLMSWKSNYKKTREKIEKTGQAPEVGEGVKGLNDKSSRQVSDRWEFPDKVLFGRTDFLAHRLEALEHVVQTVAEFQSFFGPQLKKVIGNATAIDTMFARVSQTLHPFIQVGFDVLDHSSERSTQNKIQWDALMATFNMQVTTIDQETNELINSSFGELRSTEAALQLLVHFKTISCRPSIAAAVSDKLSEILKQFTLEVEAVRTVWEQNRHSPSIPKNQPPVSGGIMWSRGLFFRIKKTLLQFESYCSLSESDGGRYTVKKYVELGKSLRRYENDLHANWRTRSEQQALELLKQPVLCIDNAGNICVNFPPELLELMRETKCLDKMGFSVGETVLNIALREQQYIMLYESLRHMIVNYTRTIEDLDPSLRSLCGKKISSLKGSMQLGFTALNWVSLGTHDFIDRTNKELSAFQGFVRLMDNNAAKVAEIVAKIRGARLVPAEHELFGDEKEGLDLPELVARIESHRTAVVDALVELHEQITPLLCKIEEVAVDQNTGRSAEMASFYNYWEKEIFRALVNAVVEGMQGLAVLMHIVRRPNSPSGLGRPLVRIHARAKPGIISTPSLTEVHKIIDKLLRGIVEATSRRFVRWMAGTCIPCPPLDLAGQDQVKLVTYYDDVSAHPNCVKMMMKVRTSLPNTAARIEKSHQRFARHAALWKDDRQILVEKFVRSKPRSSVEFDERIKHYSNIVRDLAAYPTSVTIDYVHISYDEVLTDIQSEASKWTNLYSKFLQEDASAKLNRIADKMHQIRTELQIMPVNLEEFKHLLQVIHDTRDSSSEVECVATDVEERFGVLRFYRVSIDDSELERSRLLLSEWHKIVAQARHRSLEVSKLKKEFAAATQMSCLEFLVESEQFLRRITSEGPGAPDVELDVAAERTAAFAAELKVLMQKKDSIVSAIKLFELEPVVFSVLAQAAEKIKNINEIMRVYNDFSEACRSWSSALFFSELNMDALKAGCDAFRMQFKKLPEHTHVFMLYDKLGVTLSNFEDSLPLLALLKSEAMRSRHWKKLLPSVDVNPQASSRVRNVARCTRIHVQY